MPPLFSAQYGPKDPSQDAFSLLKYMPWKGNLCKSKVAWAVTSRTRSSSNLAAAVAIEVPTIPNGTCLGSTQTWLVDKGVGIVHYPVWGCLGELLTLEQPGHPNACVCPVPGEDWKLFGYNPQPERPLSFFPTPLADYFQIFESDLDVGYDVSHCTKEVVVNMGLHGIDVWLQDQHAKHPG